MPVWIRLGVVAAVPDPLVGSALGPYRIDREIGRGGMGVVYLAEHLHLNRMVALKVLGEQLSADEPFRQRFLRESRVAASLDHPNLVIVYDAGQVGDLLYIAMRYVEGRDLREILNEKKRLSPDEAVAIVGQIASALGYAHDKLLVHRDVKPGNILVASDSTSPKAYLADFGLTRASESTSDITKTGTFLGSVDYAAPEQWKNEKMDARTDLYALACVLYECLTGSVPFDRDGQVAVMYAHMFDTPTPPSAVNASLPPAIDDVIGKALAKAPDDRYPSCRAFMDEVEKALARSATSEERSGETVIPMAEPVAESREPVDDRTAPSPAWQPGSSASEGSPTPPPRKSQAWLVVGTLLVLLAVGAFGLFLSGDEGGDEASEGTETGDSGAAGATAADSIVFRSDRDGDEEIFVMGPDGSNVTQLTDNDANDSDPSWSPNGESIVFQSDSDGDFDIYVMAADGSDLVNLTENDVDDRDPAWSPQRDLIAFSSDRDGDADIYAMSSGGDDVKRVTQNDAADTDPSWSSDSELIAYQSDLVGNDDVFLVGVDGSNITNLTADEFGSDEDPDLSPAGRELAFSREGDIFVMDLESNELSQITAGAAKETDPAFTGDGNELVFQSDRGGDEEIVITSISEPDPRPLTSNDAFDADPDRR
jgi:serine/threonine protein kinase